MPAEAAWQPAIGRRADCVAKTIASNAPPKRAVLSLHIGCDFEVATQGARRTRRARHGSIYETAGTIVRLSLAARRRGAATRKRFRTCGRTVRTARTNPAWHPFDTRFRCWAAGSL